MSFGLEAEDLGESRASVSTGVIILGLDDIVD